MPVISIPDKNTSVNFPDGTPPEVIEKTIRENFYSVEEQNAMTTFFQREGYRLRKGRSVVDVGGTGWKAMTRVISDEEAFKFEAETMKEFTLENDARFAARNLGEKFVGATTELVPYMFSSALKGVKDGAVLGGIFALAALVGGQAGPQILAPEEVITVPVAALLGFKVGQSYGAWTNASKVEGGNLYLTLRKEGINPKMARLWAEPAGYMIGAIELLQVGQVFNKFIPGGSKLGKKPIIDMILKGAKKGKPTGALKKFLDVGTRLSIEVAKRTGLEIAEEETQEIVTLAAETGAHLNEAIAKDKDYAGPTAKEATGRLKETFIQGLQGFPLLGLPGSVVSTVGGRATGKAVTPKAQESLETELQPLVEEAKKFEGVDDFINENPTNISRTDIEALGFDNHELMMEGAWDEAQREKAIDEGVSAKEVIREITPEEAAIARLTDLQKRITEAREEFVREPAKTKAEIKAVQTEIIKQLEASDLEAKDKAKFIRAIKNIQTQEQIIKAFPEIEARVVRLEIAAKKRDFSVKIKKELKTTKPLKVGQRRIGKFDFESNKTFDTLRNYNKLTQEKAQAEFDKLPIHVFGLPLEVISEVDLINKRFLSLKANGASASVEIHEQVHKDILRIKSLGKQAKDQADLEKKLNRQERVESALSSIDKIVADKDTIKTKIGNAYRRGFSNIYSMFNSIAGKEFAETYNPELSESRRNAAIYKKTLGITQGASDIYDETNIIRMFETMSLLDYEITDIKDGLTTKLSKLEIIDIYNSIKNDKKRDDYYEAFGKDQVENLIGKLTSKDTLFGDFLQEAVQGYREILNKRNIEITGLDLGFIENYWPATSEFQVSVLDDMKIQGETPSALKERAKTRVIPIPKNAWYKAQRHIAQAEHVDKISREFEALKRLFNDRKVKHAISNKFGEDVYNTIITQIDNLSLNKQTERIDAISGMFQKAINNWVTAKIALNPSTFVRQLMSVGNYAENMNVIEWTEGFFKGIASPKKTFNFVWNNAPFLEARFNKGYSEALKEAIKGAESISVNKKNWTKFLTSLVRAGDISAIVYGGFPLIQSELAKGKSMQEAIDTFEKATLKAQQSGLSSSISQFQNSKNPFARLFLAFKNTSNQYFRKMVDSVISYQNGDISLEQFAKTMSIYAVIQPILYVSAGFATKAAFSLLGRVVGLREDDKDFEDLLEKFLNDIMIQLIVSPVNAMPIIDDVVRTAARKLSNQRIYKVFSTPLFDDLEKGVRALAKKEVDGKDYLDATVSVLEPTTALPAATAIRYYEILTGKKIGKKEKKPKF